MENNPYKPSPNEPKDQGRSFRFTIMKTIKWCLLIGGGFFLLLVFLFGWVIFKTSQTHKEFDGVTEPFIQSFLQEQNPWAYDKAKPHLSEQWLDSVEEEKSKNLFQYYNKLGSLESIESTEWKGCSTVSHTSIGTVDRCNYQTIADYQAGTARISFGLVYEDESIKVIQLHVDSEAFLDQ